MSNKLLPILGCVINIICIVLEMATSEYDPPSCVSSMVDEVGAIFMYCSDNVYAWTIEAYFYLFELSINIIIHRNVLFFNQCIF